MAKRPTYKELEAKVKALEAERDRSRRKDRGLIKILSEDFQRFADRSQDAIYRLDLDTQTFPFFNARFLKLFSVEEEGTIRLTAKSSLVRIHPDDREPLRQERDRSLRRGSTGGENEYRYVNEDGSIRWMHDKWTVIREKGGRPVAIEGFIRDNTRRKQAEDELERSRKNALIGSYIVQNGKFKYVNPEFCRIIKYPKDELINTDSIQYVHPEFVDHVRSNSRQMIKGERWTPYEFCIIDKEGEVRWVMETVTSVLHEGHRAALAFFMDITKAKQTEEGTEGKGEAPGHPGAGRGRGARAEQSPPGHRALQRQFGAPFGRRPRCDQTASHAQGKHPENDRDHK